MYKRVINFKITLITLLICLITVIGCLDNLYNRDLKIVVLDVGEGDSIFIITPDNYKILIDGGNLVEFNNTVYDKGKIVVGRYLKSQGINSIDFVIATHGHSDHVGGLTSIERDFRVKNFVMSSASDLSYFGDVLKVVEERGTNLVKVAKGDRFRIGEVVLDVLSPDREYENENNNSILCRLSYKDFSMLLTGDIEREVEELMVEEGVDLDCDVLKVAHHGSDTSSTEDFVDEVSPEVAIVSVGENNYGHPASEVLDRFERVYRTDESGAVILRSDGEEIRVEEFVR